MAHRPHVMLLSLIQSQMQDGREEAFESSLRDHIPNAEVARITTCSEFLRIMGAQHSLLRMIIVMDDAVLLRPKEYSFRTVFPDNEIHSVREALVEYLRGGGNLVFAFCFTMCSKDDFNLYFKNWFGLLWTLGTLWGGNFVINEKALTQIPNFTAFPEYYNNFNKVGERNWQNPNQDWGGRLIKCPRSQDRIYVPCATSKPFINLSSLKWDDPQIKSLLSPKMDQHRRQSDPYDPQNWTFEPCNPKGPLDNDQTTLAGISAGEGGYMLLSGSWNYNEQFWEIIEAVLFAPVRIQRKKRNAPANETNINGSGDELANTHKRRKILNGSGDELANPHKKRKTYLTLSEMLNSETSQPTPATASSGSFNPDIYGDPPCCHPCTWDLEQLECDRGTPCALCQKRGSAIFCEYPEIVSR